jgi:hypothetical protein
MPNRPEDFPIFEHLSKNFIEQKIKKLEGFLDNLESFLKIEHSRIVVVPKILIEIIERIEKRRIYFHIFHQIDMGELNEGALYCFWISKFCPFYYAGIPTNVLSTKIALYLFEKTLFFYAQKTGKKVNTSQRFLSSLYYSLLYRDITKEALMLLAEEAMVE